MGCTVEARYRAVAAGTGHRVVRELRLWDRGRLAAESHMSFASG